MGETKTVLKMVFADANGKERSVSLDSPRADLAETDVKAFMNLVITKSAILTSNMDPVTTIVEAYNEVTTKTPIISPVTKTVEREL